MAKSYLPIALTAFSLWYANFAGRIVADPAKYGVLAGDAAAIGASNAAFQSAYTISTALATRTPVTVQNTITARNSGVQVIRGYGRLILANAGVADADKIALGLHIRDAVNTPIPAPLTNPIIGVLGAQPGQLTVTFKDSAAAPKIKAKPFGAVACQLYVLFGAVAPVSAAATPFYGVTTRTPFPINCPPGSAGQNAYIYARWMTAKGLVGPWSPLAVSAVV